MRAIFSLLRPCITAHYPHSSGRVHPWPATVASCWRAHFVRLNHNQTTVQDVENTNVSHSRFIAEASPQSQWNEDKKNGKQDEGNHEIPEEDFDNLSEGKGKLSPTSTHLFKLILPLPTPSSTESKPPPTVFLLHPSQPLSHVARLIIASLAPAAPSITFRSRARVDGDDRQWSDATDVGDFVKDAAQATEFTIHIAGLPTNQSPGESGAPSSPDKPSSASQATKSGKDASTTVIPVDVPTFADRTRFLRHRLSAIDKELSSMDKLKSTCDAEAHRSARRLAVSGFGLLVGYWGVVARLTFWDLGWDVMEPVTYLSGLSMVICGYLWFLYQGREVSYSSVLNRSISARRAALYSQHGFDIERWLELVQTKKGLRREIEGIAADYDRGTKGKKDEDKPEGDGKEEVEAGKVEDDKAVQDAERVRKEEKRMD